MQRSPHSNIPNDVVQGESTDQMGYYPSTATGSEALRLDPWTEPRGFDVPDSSVVLNMEFGLDEMLRYGALD